MNNSKEQTGKEEKSAEEIHSLANAWAQPDPDQPSTSNTEWELKIAYNSFIKGYRVAESELQQRIVELEAEVKRKDEALTSIHAICKRGRDNDEQDADVIYANQLDGIEEIAEQALNQKTDETQR